MKLLVLAQIPPPLHGQSLMVRTLVEGLPAQGVAVHHVPLNLSRDHADIGRWRIGKVFTVLAACARAVAARFTHGCDTLYYVPAPGKRGALYRDWVVMLLCRPFFRALVLHFHSGGLGDWLERRASAPERGLTRWLLGRAALAIVLGENLRSDASTLDAKRIAIVRNGIPDPCPGFVRPPRPAARPLTALFVGLLQSDKGVRDAIAAVGLANAADPGHPWRLVLAGPASDADFARELEALAAKTADTVERVGFVSGDRKRELFAMADVLLFPTHYAAETQGLVVAEALAHDLPVIVTAWRAVAENLPTDRVHIVPAHQPAAIAAALDACRHSPPPDGSLRRHFLAHYVESVHLRSLAEAIRSV